MIKKDMSREQYDRTKVENGVLRACYKRPISVDQVDEAVNAIETKIFGEGDREIPSSRIGEIVMEHLKALDGVAYVRFASVYREFKDINTYMSVKNISERHFLTAGWLQSANTRKIDVPEKHDAAVRPAPASQRSAGIDCRNEFDEITGGLDAIIFRSIQRTP